jgi:hypothetical protein
VPMELGHINSFGHRVLHWVVNKKWGQEVGGKVASVLTGGQGGVGG